MATSLIKHCKNCGAQFVEPSHRIKKYCSYKCFREFEDSGKTGRGHVSRTANNRYVRNEYRFRHLIKSGDPMLA